MRWRPIQPTPRKPTRGSAACAPDATGLMRDQGLEEAVRPVAGGVERLAEPFEREDMGVERARVEAAGGHGVDGVADARHVDLRVALMGVDHVEAAPVPELHVDLPRPVLVVAGDDEATALARQLGGKVERPLLADRLDHAVAEGAAGQLLDARR